MVSASVGLRKRNSSMDYGGGNRVLFLAIVGYAKATGQWNTNFPRQVCLELVPNASVQQPPVPGRSKSLPEKYIMADPPRRRLKA